MSLIPRNADFCMSLIPTNSVFCMSLMPENTHFKYKPYLDKWIFLYEPYSDKCRFLLQLWNIMVSINHDYPDNYCRPVCNAVCRRLWGPCCLHVGSLECHIVKDSSCRIYRAAENPRSDDCRVFCQVARDAVLNKAASLWCWLIGPLCRLLVLFNAAVSFSDRIALVIVNKLSWSIGLVVQSGENRSTRRKNLPHCHVVNKEIEPGPAVWDVGDLLPKVYAIV
jgi:hypothetical protein